MKGRHWAIAFAITCLAVLTIITAIGRSLALDAAMPAPTIHARHAALADNAAPPPPSVGSPAEFNMPFVLGAELCPLPDPAAKERITHT